MRESMITAKEVAERLGVSVHTVYRLKDKPDGIPAYRLAGCIRFRPDEVDAYIEGHAVKPAVKKDPMPGMRRFQYTPGMKVVEV